MNKVRITAIRQTVYQDLIDQYENPIEHACDIQQGQQWISVNGKCPEGLCPSAWDSMKPFVQSLAQGKGNFFDGWMKNPMSAMISCNDGFRPFSFYIEAIEEPGTSSRQTGGVASAEKGSCQSPILSSAFKPEDRVSHRVFGEGTVVRVYRDEVTENDKIEINFDRQGTKTLLLTHAKLERI